LTVTASIHMRAILRARVGAMLSHSSQNKA
jgi:hypothetical protein